MSTPERLPHATMAASHSATAPSAAPPPAQGRGAHRRSTSRSAFLSSRPRFPPPKPWWRIGGTSARTGSPATQSAPRAAAGRRSRATPRGRTRWIRKPSFNSSAIHSSQVAVPPSVVQVMVHRVKRMRHIARAAALATSKAPQHRRVVHRTAAPASAAVLRRLKTRRRCARSALAIARPEQYGTTR